MDIDKKSPFYLENWVVEPAFNQVSQGDVVRRVEPKVMSVLLVLAAQSRQVVSKERILCAVWPNTHVGEDALTRCISALRHAFGDDPHRPHFIRTVSKAGYCLLVDAAPLPATQPDAAAAISRGPAHEQDFPSTAVATAASQARLRPGKMRKLIYVALAGLGLAAVACLAVWAVHARRVSPGQPSFQTFQMTTQAGEQSSPALSPDGKRLAFVLSKEDGGLQHIYIKKVGEESLQRLSDGDDREFSPAWSPDGQQVAFLSHSLEGLALDVASPARSSASLHRIYIPNKSIRWEQGALSWSPDGKSMVLADQAGSQANSSIYLVDLATLQAHSMTTPPAGWEGDFSPVFSPDGQKVAFLRASDSEVTDIYWVPALGGEAHQVTQDRKLINGITWSADSRNLVFSSDRAGQFALWKIAVEGGEAQRMPVGADNSSQPAISASGDRLAYVQGSSVFAILRVGGHKDGAQKDNEQIVLSSTADDSAPSASHDGQQIAFQSWRSGSQQLWLSSSDGQSLRQLTANNGALSTPGTPEWNPAGDRIAFDARSNGHSHIFVIAPSGGATRQITFGEDNDVIPRWSNDGRFLYFRSNRGGRWQLWKQAVAGGTPQPMTGNDGMNAQESADGNWLYFAKGDEGGLWRMPIAGGAAVQFLTQPATGYWGYWAVTRSGIFFLDQEEGAATISVFDPLSGKTSTFAKLDRVPPKYYSGMSALGGGEEILICSKRSVSRHISIAQGTF